MKYFIALALTSTALLSGCAVYEPAGYVSYPPPAVYYPYAERSYSGALYAAPPVYVAPPVYAAPPVYVGPPVSFSFGFLFGGHSGHHGGWRHHH